MALNILENPGKTAMLILMLGNKNMNERVNKLLDRTTQTRQGGQIYLN